MYFVKVRKTKDRGRGVFATKKFIKGEIIERCPVIVLSKKDAKVCQNTALTNYLYDWQEYYKTCLPLGYGLIYNHSYSPNARYGFDHTKRFIVFSALKTIRQGQEITVNYNYFPDDTSPTDVSDVPPKN